MLVKFIQFQRGSGKNVVLILEKFSVVQQNRLLLWMWNSLDKKHLLVYIINNTEIVIVWLNDFS